MTNRPLPEELLLLFIDCPLCAAPAPMDVESGSLDCPACCVHLELADEPAIPELAKAA